MSDILRSHVPSNFGMVSRLPECRGNFDTRGRFNYHGPPLLPLFMADDY